MDRDEFMELVYETFADDPDNVLANGIIEAAGAYAEHEKTQLSCEGATFDMISRQAVIDAIVQCTNCGNEDTLRKYVLKHNLDNGWTGGILEALDAVKDLPPVQPEPQWIPVSERLPEEDDYKSCIECLDGAVWYFTEKGTMGIGYYYESTKEWSTTDDLKTDGKVIAWMPLPEPYQKGATP